MNKWEQFELNAIEYLNSLYKELPVMFKGKGGANSNEADIEVFKKSEPDNVLFTIEAKLTPSQSGQFVVKEEAEEYIFSPLNKGELNKPTLELIEALNQNKSYYSPKAQGAIDINVKKELLTEWVIEHYKSKGSLFIISSNEVDGCKRIIPINKISKYYNVTACIRRKKSGSRNVPRYLIESCLKELSVYLRKKGTPSLKNLQVLYNNNGLLVKLPGSENMKKSERSFGESYFLSKTAIPDEYFIKYKAKTNSLSIIFSLKYIGPQNHSGDQELKDAIKNKLNI